MLLDLPLLTPSQSCTMVRINSQIGEQGHEWGTHDGPLYARTRRATQAQPCAHPPLSSANRRVPLYRTVCPASTTAHYHAIDLLLSLSSARFLLAHHPDDISEQELRVPASRGPSLARTDHARRRAPHLRLYASSSTRAAGASSSGRAALPNIPSHLH